MRIFRRRTNGKSTEHEKRNRVKTRTDVICSRCGYKITQMFEENELKYWAKDNHWRVTDTEIVCPKCIYEETHKPLDTEPKE